MAKKIKLKDLADEPDFTTQLTGVTRISLDDLKDLEPAPLENKPENFAEEPQKLTEPKRSTLGKSRRVTSEPKAPPRVMETLTLKKDVTLATFRKLLSLGLIALIVDVVIHFMKVFEEVDVLNPENFVSVLPGDTPQETGLRIMGILVLSYFLAPTDSLKLNERGINAKHTAVMNFFWTSVPVFITWEEIAKAEYSFRLLEPVLFFFDREGEALGQIDFQITSRPEFFRLIEKFAGVHHPIMKLKKEIIPAR